MKIALVGDSVFDNKAYVGSEKSTQEWLQQLMPNDDISLIAVDGSVTQDVINHQIRSLAEQDVDAFFLSTGGNDAILAVRRWQKRCLTGLVDTLFLA